MSDPQSAPAAIPVPPAPGPAEKSAHQNNRSNNSHGGGGRGGNQGGRGRGGGSRSGSGRGDCLERDRLDDDRDGSGRRKKPELQHYKPGAFNSTRRSDYEGGGNNNSNHHYRGGYDNNSGYNSENRKMSVDQYSDRGGSRGGRSGSGRNKNHNQGQNDVDNATEKVGQLSFDDNQQHQQHQGQQRERTGTGKRKSKKPEQPHYSAKKVIGSNENSPEIGSETQGNNEESGNTNKETPVVVTKPPQQPAKPVPAADDTKSEGGGSNTGTARRNRNKNKSRSSVEKTVSPASAGAPVSKDNQQQGSKNVRSNGGGEERPPSGSKHYHNQQQQHGHHKGYGSGGYRQNGFTENAESVKTEEFHQQQHSTYQHQEGGGRGRHGGGGSGGRNKTRGGGQSPSESGRNSLSRKSSPSNRDHPQRYHDDSNRSSVDRNVIYNDRRSPSTGSTSAQIGGPGSQNQRPHSPSRRGGSSSVGAGPASLGPRHQRAGGLPGAGYNRNAETSDWRYHREASHEDYTSSSYQQPQQSFDRWGNDFNRSGGRGGKSQAPKTNIPPRFQRVQQQQHHQFEESYAEPQPTPPQPAIQQPFRRRGSGRRTGEADAERSWRRSSNSSSVAPENGADQVTELAKDVEDAEEELSRVNDWSVEVEEEERMERRAGSETPIISASTTASTTPERGGIIRLPPPHAATVAQGPDSGSWRAASEHQDANNPAWRGLQHHEAAQMRNAVGAGYLPPQQSGPGAPYWQNRPPRYLFDHKNPNKPIPAPSYPAAGVPGVLRPPAGAANMARFPVDPRFAHPPPVTAYRHPFPPMNQPPPTARPPPTPHDLRPIPAAMEEIIRARMMLHSIIHTGGPRLLAEKWDTDVAECRRNTLSAFKHLLENDLVYCAHNDVEFQIWQICFYILVEALKTLLPNDSSNSIHQTIVDLIDEGIDFYEAMLETLDKTYRIGLDNFYDVLEPRSTDKMVRCVLVSAQKCLLCLGDLARYKEQVQESANYGTARQFYQKASNIDTRNGRPFNQLAILAQTTKRKFEAVYYNMRCLQTSSPIKSSQEFLTMIFEEVRRKWEASEKKRIEEREAKRREADKEKELDSGSSCVRGTKLRKEVWIRPEGGRRLHRTTSAREGDSADDLGEDAALKELSTSDLNRRFNNSFLYLIGKLFTHINMDTFGVASDLLLKEFRVLVSRTPLPIDAKRLVQIMALNMFIIDYTKMKGQDSENYRTVAQNSALQLAFGMFGVLVERCNVLLGSFTPKADSLVNGENNLRSSIFHEEDLPTLLSAVKVWCDWILGNNDIWFPVVCTEPFRQLAQLATHLEKLKPIIKPTLATFIKEDTLMSSPDRRDYEMVKLEEDSLLCGFNPWFRGLDWALYRRYAPRSIPSTLVQDVRRLDAINFCIEFLEGHEPPIFKWSPQDNAHLSLVENGSTVEKLKFDKLNSSEEISRLIEKGQDILDESYSDDDDESVNEADKTLTPDMSNVEMDDIRRLKRRKEELERRHKQEEESRRLRSEILAEHVSVKLEICPKILVPDTNCFVDHLSDLGRLSSVGTYQLRVPLVVLNELDGLAKGTTRSHQNKYSSPEHALMVADNAKRALTWLKDRPANTKCVTSRGTVLASLAVTTEATMDDGKNNDDLILDVCLNLTTKDHRSVTVEDELRVVRRDVVLLTDDRNLKLKAHTTDIPVNAMPDFIRWAFPAPGN